ncbi:hypothetical protein ASG68_29630 [Rhizobium sp. Leaf453]|nr:hypothetical protein ASG50_28815 [Rhizobium sp. Leaf386]KQS95075.1 hypothetical protein ASG42_30205 [Rhizobium sp. Leaf391]KQU00066.1 hypothetical protein ASG68_29630 [Rhizobium sp. Leaf453]
MHASPLSRRKLFSLEWGYLTPADIETKGVFLTLLEVFYADYAGNDSISRSGWATYTVVAVDDQDET